MCKPSTGQKMQNYSPNSSTKIKRTSCTSSERGHTRSQTHHSWPIFVPQTNLILFWFLMVQGGKKEHMKHFCIKNNEFGVKGVSGGLDLCHFPARKVVGVKKCGFWSEFHQLFCCQIGLRSNHTHQSKKKGGENLPLKDSVRGPVCWAKMVHFWKPWKHAL